MDDALSELCLSASGRRLPRYGRARAIEALGTDSCVETLRRLTTTACRPST